MQVDLTIVGAGLAGLSASIEAASLDPNARILLLERDPKVGGNSAKASSGINGAISDADEFVFEQDTLQSGGGLSNEQLVHLFVKQSPSAIQFLKELDVDLSVLCQLGGHSVKRTHRNKCGPNIGFAIISALQKKIPKYPNIQVLTNTSAQHFIIDPMTNQVIGLQFQRMESKEIVHVHSKAIILATGGFSANEHMLQRFAPGLESFPTTNGPCAQGDGILMAEEVGAELTLMNKVQLHPTGFINPKDREARQKFLAPEAIRGSGALLINTNGKRFVNELATRDVVSQAILHQPHQKAFMWLFEGASTLTSSLRFYKQMGLVKQVATIQQAAEYCHLNAEAMLDELNEYASIASRNQPDPFGKTIFPFPISPIASIETPIEIHVMEIAPAVHYCMGGIKINQHTQVLRSDGSIIPRVYAIGEVSGGLHGANRLGGNSLAECVIFGRIAAQQAIAL